MTSGASVAAGVGVAHQPNLSTDAVTGRRRRREEHRLGLHHPDDFAEVHALVAGVVVRQVVGGPHISTWIPGNVSVSSGTNGIEPP